MRGRIAFVPPRFGRNVIGGSESAARQIAIGLAARGWDVEVLTTCAINHYSWANELPEGTTVEDGLVVRRFENQHHVSGTGRRAQLKIQAGEVPTLDEQMSWLSWRFSVPGLFEHLVRRGEDYQAVVFEPYMFWTTTVCLPPVRERAIAMPCLHDEVYARLDVVRPVLEDAARVWFLSEPEHALAHRLGPLSDQHTVTGTGVAIPSGYNPERFRRRYGITRPFLLYAGRREPEKGWDWLVEQYADAVLDHGVDVDLISVGVGEARAPDRIAHRVRDLGSVSNADRDDAMAAALAYAQPSKMESFSLSIMEAWLAGTPVLAVRGSEVVGWHCDRSGGGRLFDNGAELAAILRQLTDDPAERAAMAERGRTYVVENYAWPVVLDRMEADLEKMP